MSVLVLSAVFAAACSVVSIESDAPKIASRDWLLAMGVTIAVGVGATACVFSCLVGFCPLSAYKPKPAATTPIAARVKNNFIMFLYLLIYSIAERS